MRQLLPVLAIFLSTAAFAADCGDMSYWDISMNMCTPLPMAGMPMKMAMVHGNLFGVRIWQEGPRGADNYAGPNMVMGDLGSSVGDHHYLNVDLMATTERWTFPYRGYPLLLQIGEQNQEGVPFIDAQHPHSSPIMGLTFSDTISFGSDKDNIKVFFAPRGEATDGPIAFMHRVTGMVNPDAPLGHHVGQDVGHISSTVIGGSLKLGSWRFEASTYHGAEPEPDAVDLPLGVPNSVSLRVIKEWNPQWLAMISAARVTSPEPDEPSIPYENRYSASVYTEIRLANGWTFNNALIYGAVTQYDHASFLSSVDEEFLFKGPTPRIWGRFEVLQRTPAELLISDSNSGRWVSALTLGYTHRLAGWEEVELGLGGSVTKDFLPTEFIGSYGSDPWSGKIFLQLSGMKMWEL